VRRFLYSLLLCTLFFAGIRGIYTSDWRVFIGGMWGMLFGVLIAVVWRDIPGEALGALQRRHALAGELDQVRAELEEVRRDREVMAGEVEALTTALEAARGDREALAGIHAITPLYARRRAFIAVLLGFPISQDEIIHIVRLCGFDYSDRTIKEDFRVLGNNEN